MIPVVSLVVFIVLGALVIYPLFKDIKNSSEEFALARQEQALFLERKKAIENMKAILEGHRENLEKMEDLLIDPENPLEFINSLEGEAAKANVELKISSLSFFKGDQGLWPSFLFRLTTVGSFPDFLRFMERLESAPYLIQVSDLGIKVDQKRVAEESGPSDVTANFSMKVFTK